MSLTILFVWVRKIVRKLTCTFRQALFREFEVQQIVDICQSIRVILALILVQLKMYAIL